MGTLTAAHRELLASVVAVPPELIKLHHSTIVAAVLELFTCLGFDAQWFTCGSVWGYRIDDLGRLHLVMAEWDEKKSDWAPELAGQRFRHWIKDLMACQNREQAIEVIHALDKRAMAEKRKDR